MKPAARAAACSRLWEAEALEQGRLSGTDRLSFERHSATCTACRRELESIAALKKTLSLIEAPTTVPLARQRIRAQLLRGANARALQPSLADQRSRIAWLAAAVIVAAGGAGVASLLLRARRPPPVIAETVTPPPRVDAESSAIAAGALPAGSTPAIEPSPDPIRRRSADSHALAATAPPPPPATRAGALFDAAMASFEAGAYDRADAELDHFAREYPSDPRSEDAAYLRTVARWRLGDRSAAAKLAQAYLAKYPAGLRRPEARRILDQTAPPPP